MIRINRLHSFVVGLFVGSLLGLFLFGLKEGTDPFEDIRAQDERCCDDGLATSHIAFSTLLVLILVCIESPVFGGVGSLQWPVDVANDCILDILRLGLDNRYLLVKLGEELVTELVGFGNVGFCVGSWSLKVGERGLDKFGVAGVCQLN